MTEEEITKRLAEMDEEHSAHASMVTACAVVIGFLVMFAGGLLYVLARVLP